MGRAVRIGRAGTFLVALSEGAVWGLGFGYILFGECDLGPAVGTVAGVTVAAIVAGRALDGVADSSE